MEFFRKRRINKAVRATLAAAERDDELATSFIGGLEAGERADAWCQVVDAVMDDEGDEAVIRQAIERALEADPDHWGAWEAMASLEQSLEGRSGETMAAYEKLHALDAENSVVRLELAVLLMLAGRVEEALPVIEGIEQVEDPEDGLRLGQALFAAGELKAAESVLASARKQCEQALKTATFADNFKRLEQVFNEVSEAHGAAYAEIHGQEAVIDVAAKEGMLDAGQGVNLTLLGESLMARSGPLTTVLELQAPAQEMDRGTALLAQGEVSHGHALLGSAYLRGGDADRALEEFEEAAAADGQNFAAFLGQGAAMDAQRFLSFDRVWDLPDFDDLPGVERVVPDLGALTACEHRVVLASAWPLRRQLASLAEAGASIRLLPIDVRPTDLPELSTLQNERDADHRTPAAQGGLATDRVAVSRVVELVNVEAATGLTFAHELAHLVFMYLPEDVRGEVERFHQLGAEAGYVFGTYAMSNVDEFFAGAYEMYLRHVLRLRDQQEFDEDGLLEGVFELFEGLAE